MSPDAVSAVHAAGARSPITPTHHARATQDQPIDVDQVRSFEALLAENQQQVQLNTDPGLGDALVDGLHRLEATRDSHVRQVNDLVAGLGDHPMSVADGMRLQVALLQMTLHQDITTKAADKTSQGVQTLFRNQ